MPDSVLALTDVTRRFGQVTALDGLTLQAVAGKVTAILGPNGAGKSTTLRLTEGYLRPDAGTVRVFGLDPVAHAEQLRPRVGVMLQAGGLPAAIRPVEAVRFAASLYAHPLDADALISQLGIDQLGRTPFRRLSGGEQRRVALAIALVGRPELLILDEPTSGMDPQSRRLTWDVISSARDAGVTVVVSTHLMDEASELADDVLIIDHGRVIAAGTPAELTAGEAEQLTFAAPVHLPIESLQQALPAGLHVAENPPGRYAITGPLDAQVLATVTAWCAAHNAMTSDLSVRRRSLEDVFLELTGRELRS